MKRESILQTEIPDILLVIYMLKTIVLLAVVLSSPKIQFYGGTIIAMLKDGDRLIVVADSRSSNNAGAHRDDVCKIMSLGEKGFFFASGRTLLVDNKGTTIFDISDVARRIFNDFSHL